MRGRRVAHGLGTGTGTGMGRRGPCSSPPSSLSGGSLSSWCCSVGGSSWWSGVASRFPLPLCTPNRLGASCRASASWAGPGHEEGHRWGPKGGLRIWRAQRTSLGGGAYRRGVQPPAGAARSFHQLVEPHYLSAGRGLSPCFSREAVHGHVWKHHLAHLQMVNKLCEGTEFQDLDLDKIVTESLAKGELTLHNHATLAWNHQFFWECMREAGGPGPSADLLERFDIHFGGLERFKQKFTAHVQVQLGSGWVWLVDQDGHLQIVNVPNVGCVLTKPLWHPILVLDVWEHAYYPDHGDDRKKYVDNWWSVVNWEFVEQRIQEADKRNSWLYANQGLKSYPAPAPSAES